ncbi:MAG: hypothetical protein OXU36_10230 [Candidatus Poribacteria bacterium]|nr:hypothetical protein [Candidatus Poribacteria bacterium]
MKKNEMKLTFLIFSGILLLFGCGSDETPEPIEQMPNYFPDAVGSRWTYLNSDGTQGTTEVSGETNIDGKRYRIIKDTPQPKETEFDPLKPVYYRVTENQVFFAVGGEIDGYVQNELLASVQDDFAGLELSVAVDAISDPELTFFQFPLIPNSQWEALNLKISGSISLQNLALLQFPFEVIMRVTGEVIADGPLETTAGSFVETYQIEYQTEITQTLFSETETWQDSQAIWFAPHVGIVKTENEDGDGAVLIAYSLAPAEN